MTPAAFSLRPATCEDANHLARLIDIAGEGIPAWLWQKSTAQGQTPLDIGVQRAQRDEGGFSYTNATVATTNDTVCGMVLSYAITKAPEDAPETLPDPIVPFVELERLSVGSWYVNALATFPAWQGKGIGAQLLAATEQDARTNGYDRVTIQVFEQNHGARRLYDRNGYRACAAAPVRLHPCQPYYDGQVLLLEKAV
jgi:ribosomal protein S18 acetylase RimI-like enzyme